VTVARWGGGWGSGVGSACVTVAWCGSHALVTRGTCPIAVTNDFCPVTYPVPPRPWLGFSVQGLGFWGFRA
jgi:hypothetical protein